MTPELATDVSVADAGVALRAPAEVTRHNFGPARQTEGIEPR